MYSLHFGRNFSEVFLPPFITATGYLPAGESTLLFLLCVCIRTPRVRSSPAFTCLPLTFLTLRRQCSTFVAFKRLAIVPYSFSHIADWNTRLRKFRFEEKKRVFLISREISFFFSLLDLTSVTNLVNDIVTCIMRQVVLQDWNYFELQIRKNLRFSKFYISFGKWMRHLILLRWGFFLSPSRDYVPDIYLIIVQTEILR